jgi:hypothetical protein
MQRLLRRIRERLRLLRLLGMQWMLRRMLRLLWLLWGLLRRVLRRRVSRFPPSSLGPFRLLRRRLLGMLRRLLRQLLWRELWRLWNADRNGRRLRH